MNRFRNRKSQAALLGTLFASLICLAVLAGCASAVDKSEEESARIAALLDLKAGMTIADIGAGKGKFTVDLARRIGPTGKVYSTELNADRRTDIRKAASTAHLTNIIVVKAGEQETNLPTECCDAILIRTVYHHFTNPEAMNASLFRVLRPNGLLVLIEFGPNRWLSLISRPKGVPKNRGGHGIPLNILLPEVTRAGFEKIRVIEHWGESHAGNLYCVLFRRPPPVSD